MFTPYKVQLANSTYHNPLVTHLTYVFNDAGVLYLYKTSNLYSIRSNPNNKLNKLMS